MMGSQRAAKPVAMLVAHARPNGCATSSRRTSWNGGTWLISCRHHASAASPVAPGAVEIPRSPHGTCC